MPAVNLPPNPGDRPVDGPLKLVISLMFANLGLSVVLTALILLFRDSVVDFQLSHTAHIDLLSAGQVEVLRQTLQTALWVRVASVLVVSALYIWRAYALRRGSRGAYLRLIWICVFGIIGIAYIIVAGQYPVWMRVEQVLQAAVLVALLISVTRKQVRDRYAKVQY